MERLYLELLYTEIMLIVSSVFFSLSVCFAFYSNNTFTIAHMPTSLPHPQVTKNKQWKDVAAVMGIGASSSGSYTLRKHYMKHILAYECKFDRGGVDPQPIINQIETAAKKKTTKTISVPSPGERNSHFLPQFFSHSFPVLTSWIPCVLFGHLYHSCSSSSPPQGLQTPRTPSPLLAPTPALLTVSPMGPMWREGQVCQVPTHSTHPHQSTGAICHNASLPKQHQVSTWGLQGI